MKFSLAAFVSTVVLMVISGAVSLMEGTFTSKKVTMGFLNHGGMWSDLIILSVVTGLVCPYLVSSRIAVFSTLFIAFTITIVMHFHWMRIDGITGHMFRIHGTGKWYRDMSLAGWMHVIVMTGLLMIVLMYVVSATPPKIVITVSILLTLHVFLAAVQPGWYCTGKFWTWPNFGPPLILTLLIWSVALVKFRLAKAE